MLYRIKASFYIELIFYHPNEGIKLKLIKYNKNLKNILGININDYKKYSGRYIIYETKKKGKEYYSNYCKKIQIFEGEYLNGERNGKGKEFYDDGILKFEGEYLKGKRNGKGKRIL